MWFPPSLKLWRTKGNKNMVEEDKSISLIPGVSEEELGKKKSKSFYGVSFLIIVIAALIYGILWYYHFTVKKQVDQVRVQIAEEQKKIDAIGEEAQKFLSFKQRLDTLDKILNERAVAWSYFLEQLTKFTVSGVYYSSLTVGKEGKVNLSGEAKSAGDIARLLVSLQNKPPENSTPFDNVELHSSVSYGSEAVPFSISLNLQKSALQRSK